MSPGRERRVGRIREVWSSCGLSGALAWLLLGLTITSECRAQESLYQAYWDAGSKAFQAKDWNTAQQMYQKSYDAAVAAWGANSVQAAETSFNVGASWLNQGKTAEARENYLRAYRIVYQSADPKIRDFTVDTALQVAKCHNRMKDFEKALPLLKWGLAVREKANPTSQGTADYYAELTDAHAGLRDFNEALAAARARLKALSARLSATADETVSARSRIAELLDAAGKKAESADEYLSLARDLEERGDTNNPRLGRLNWFACALLNGLRRYPEAESAGRKALKYYDRGGEPERGNVLLSLNLLASVLMREQKFDEAESLYKRVLQMREQQQDEAGIAASLANLAHFYEVREQPEKAETLLQEKLQEREKVVGADSEKLAAVLTVFGQFYARLGKHDRAEEMLKRALANRERHLPPDHLEVANSLEALADFYEPLSRYLDAEPLYFRALSIREKQLGPEHAKVASSLKESAWILMRLGRFREGIPLARRSVRIYESLGRDHEAELVWAYNALAGLVDDDKDYIEAESLYRKALAIVDRRGDDPESLGVLTHNLANCLTAQGRYIEARALYARAVELREQVIAESSDRIQEFLRKAWNRANELNNLAGCEYVLGARDDARRNYDKALTLAEKDFGAEHYQVMRALRGLARLEQFHGKIADAEALLERAGKIAAARKAENPNDWASHEEQLAGLRQFQGRLKEARELFESARKTRAAAPGFSGDLEELDDSLAGLDLIEGKWPQSAARFERRIHALEKIRADHFGETFPLIELGLVYSMMGRFDDAAKTLQRALRLAETGFGPGHTGLFEATGALAEVELLSGRLDEAAAAADRQVAEATKRCGADSVQVAICLVHRSWVSAEREKWTEAAEDAQKASAIFSEIIPPDHYYSADCAVRLGEALLGAGDAKAAEAQARLALRIRLDVYGERNHRIAVVRSLLGRALLAQSDPDSAEQELRLAYEIRKENAGEQNHLTARQAVEYAQVLTNKGNLESAEKLLREALKSFELQLPGKHPQVARCVESLAGVLEKQSRADEAAALRKRFAK